MTLKSLEQFEKETAAKRAELERHLALAHKLPTNGVMVTWTGEGGWEKDGNTRKPDIERSIELFPYIIHSPFRGAQHVAFKAPDTLTGEGGEHVSSQHRTAFVHRYLQTLLKACEPFMVETLAVRGTYASLVPETFNYKAHKDYSDAAELARGLYEVEVSEHSAKVSWYINTSATGPMQISFDLWGGSFGCYRLHARGIRSSDYERSTVARWEFPSCDEVGAVHVFKRANTTRTTHGVPDGYTMEWLFDSTDAMLTAIGVLPE